MRGDATRGRLILAGFAGSMQACRRSRSAGAVALLGTAAGGCSRTNYRHLHHRRRCLRAASSAAECGGSGGGPLAGLTVLDCGNFLAGPIVSLHLAAMGADVIKIEKPQNGDDGRAVGPFADDGSSSYHLSTNRGKRSVAIDTRTDAGREVFLDLAAKADILVENFRPGVMDRLGVGYDALSKRNPGLIYASVSGFGQHGPHASRPAFDSLLQAAGGLISVTGPAAGSENAASGAEGTVRVGVSIVDICSGLHALVAVLAALHYRTLTGRGQRVDTSMLAVTANLMESPISRHSYCGGDFLPKPEGLAHPAVAPFDGFQTADGILYIATSNDARAHVTMKALGLDELVDCPEYATNSARMANRDKLKTLIEGKLAHRTTSEWEALLIPAGVPCSAINNVAELKARHPEVFVTVHHPTAGMALQSGAPFEFGDPELQQRAAWSAGNSEVHGGVDYGRPAPELGQHTDEILRNHLGYSEEATALLRESGVIR